LVDCFNPINIDFMVFIHGFDPFYFNLMFLVDGLDVHVLYSYYQQFAIFILFLQKSMDSIDGFDVHFFTFKSENS
jgi:hypothetical protein